MRRRALLATPVLAVAGCGFRLRSSQSYAFDRVAISPVQSAGVAGELARYLGERVVGRDAAPQVLLEVLQEQREKTVVAVNASGQVREFQLRIRVRFRLRTPQGAEPIPDTEIALYRDISFSESAALAKEAEEQMLYRDMQSDVVQQILRRLGAVKNLTGGP